MDLEAELYGEGCWSKQVSSSLPSLTASPVRAAPQDEASASPPEGRPLSNWGSQSPAMVALEVLELTEVRDRQ